MPEHRAADEDVENIVDECFFAVGQAIGTAKTLDADAVRWWQAHYRNRFGHAVRCFGNRWHQDGARVIAVASLLAKRALVYAGDRRSIDLRAAQSATEDVERYCTLHSMRHARRMGFEPQDDDTVWIAGYWCIPPGIGTAR